jgi:uncharacterized LabA/DUF88 family protein
MQRCVILVDNTNIFIGGKILSAREKGTRPNPGHDDPIDPAWRLNFKGLYDCLAEGREVADAIMVGSVPIDGEAPWEDAAREAGFQVIIHEISAHSQEKSVDTELVARGTEIVSTAETPGTLVIASGDQDFVPLIDAAHRHGWNVEIHAFQDSFSRAGKLAEAADRVRTLDGCLSDIGWSEERKQHAHAA